MEITEQEILVRLDRMEESLKRVEKYLRKILGESTPEDDDWEAFLKLVDEIGPEALTIRRLSQRKKKS